MKTTGALLLLLCTLPLAACARAEALLDVQVVDLDAGSALHRIPHAGRDYIAGQPGHRFSVAMQNLTGERVMAVLSVDGINAISGQTASTSQAGYVLEPWQRVEIRGWRKSYSDVAEFYFTDLPDSYAARTGRPRNVGVVGVAVFRGRRPEPVYYNPPPPPMIGNSATERAADASAQAGAATGTQSRRDSSAPSATAQQIGTGHGQRRYDPVTQTHFQRLGSRPNQQIAFYYDSYQALVERGVIRNDRRYGQPEPFPVGFAPDP